MVNLCIINLTKGGPLFAINSVYPTTSKDKELELSTAGYDLSNENEMAMMMFQQNTHQYSQFYFLKSEIISETVSYSIQPIGPTLKQISTLEWNISSLECAVLIGSTVNILKLHTNNTSLSPSSSSSSSSSHESLKKFHLQTEG